MKSAFILFSLFIAGSGYADTDTINTSDATSASIAKYDQPQEFISLQAGAYRPSSISVSNGTYTFNYGADSQDTILAEAMFGHRLVHGNAGSLFFEEALSYAGFSGQSNLSSEAGTTLHLNTLGLDSRVGYFLDHLPVAWLVPFADAGYQLAFYNQSGSTDFDSVEGLTGNIAGGVGIRFWLNPASLDRDYFARSPGFPIYLSLKLNRIFPNGSPLDLASTNWLAGLTMGL